MTAKTSLRKPWLLIPAICRSRRPSLWKVDPRRLTEIDGFNLRDYDDPDVIAQIEAFADAYANGRYVPPLIVWVDDTGNISPGGRGPPAPPWRPALH